MRLRAQIVKAVLNRNAGEVYLWVNVTTREHEMVDEVVLSRPWRDQDYKAAGVNSDASEVLEQAIELYLADAPGRGFTAWKQMRAKGDELPVSSRSIHFDRE